MEMDVQDRHQNNYGDYTHGGILMGLLDISALLSGIHDKRGTVDVLTLSLTTNFIAAAHSERVAAEGELVHIGRSTFFARSKVMDIASGELLAPGDGVFRIRVKKSWAAAGIRNNLCCRPGRARWRERIRWKSAAARCGSGSPHPRARDRTRRSF